VRWSMTLKSLALRLCCSHNGQKAAEVVAVGWGEAPAAYPQESALTDR
jgi:hypothetical protein